MESSLLGFVLSLVLLVTPNFPFAIALFEFSSFCPDYPRPVVAESTIAQNLQPFFEILAANISSYLQQTESPGAAILGVVYDQTLLWYKGFGQTNKLNTGPPDVNTPFRIASNTKLFTSLMMLQLRDQGLLSLEDELDKHLPEFKIQNPFQSARSITLKQLASHMAGLPLETPCENMFILGCNSTDKEIYNNIAMLKLISPPGSQPSYSNMGFAALGHALGNIMDTSWEKLLDKMVLSPLGLQSSGVDYNEHVKKTLAIGYTEDGTEADLIDIGWEAPAGQMYSSLGDFSELVKLVFRDNATYKPDSKQLLDGETLREWMQPAYVYFDGTGYGYPWEILPSRNYSLRTKAGSINGYLSRVAIAPEIKTGVILFQSCDCSSFDMVREMAEQVFPATAAALKEYAPYPDGPFWLQNYTGVFSSSSVPGLVEIKTDYPTLTLSMPGLPNARLNWLKDEEFQISLHSIPHSCFNLGLGFVGEYVYFNKKKDAIAEGLTIPGVVYGVEFKRVTSTPIN